MPSFSISFLSKLFLFSSIASMFLLYSISIAEKPLKLDACKAELYLNKKVCVDACISSVFFKNNVAFLKLKSACEINAVIFNPKKEDLPVCALFCGKIQKYKGKYELLVLEVKPLD